MVYHDNRSNGDGKSNRHSQYSLGHSVHSTQSLFSIGKICHKYGLSQPTVRKACDSGQLRCFTLPSGHRRISESDMDRFLGQGVDDTEVTDTSTPYAVVCRVSNQKQNRPVGNSKLSSLDQQIDQCRLYVVERYGQKVWDNSHKYFRCASGLNFTNDIFVQFLKDLVSGKFRNGRIISVYEDRIMRLGVNIISELAKMGNTTIEYIQTISPDDDPISEMLSDVLSIMTYYTAKCSGQKSREKTLVKMDDESLKECFHLYQQGYSYKKLQDMMSGRINEKGQSYSRGITRANLIRNNSTLSTLLPQKGIDSSFGRFCKSCVRSSGESSRLSRIKLLERYRGFCVDNGENELSGKKISVEIKKMGWEKRFNDRGNVVYCGLGLIRGETG